MDEVKLSGGRSTPCVVRAGNTVRRPVKSSSCFVREVLLFLEEKGYPYAHRFLGIDEQGRDIFSYVTGFVPDDIGNTTPEQLFAFMPMIRLFHDVSTGFTGNVSKVLCHNDLSPCNTVFLADVPVSVIDWDSVSIGERWEDIVYILWLWINIGSHSRNTGNILSQMVKALQLYGVDESTVRDLPEKLIWRMDKVCAEMSADNLQYDKTCAWVAFSKEWVIENSAKINTILKDISK